MTDATAAATGAAHGWPSTGELQPITAPGIRWVQLAEEHAKAFAERTAELDVSGAFPHENFAEMRASGFLGAFVPEELGGLGALSIHDWAVAMERIARADASTAIAVNMHFISSYTMVRHWREAEASGEGAPEGLTQVLRAQAAGGIVCCGLGTENGTAQYAPRTTAVPVEGGWLLNGRKSFGTSSPEANILLAICRVETEDGPRIGYANVMGGTKGLEGQDNWDALGMRSSGSQDVVLNDVFVPSELMQIGDEPWGKVGGGFISTLGPAVLGLSGAFLGIAEAARAQVVPLLSTRKKGPSDEVFAKKPMIQHLLGELDTQLAASRAVLARSCLIADAYFAAVPPSEDTLESIGLMMYHVQAAKQFVNREAVDIVDRAMTLSGGSGFSSRNPLSRMYRDVRAGGFMQPFTAIEGYAFMGRVVFGGDLAQAD